MTKPLREPLLDVVDVRHLHYFAVVAEEHSLRRAAERLGMTQPPLSRQIKQLEEQLGAPLFVRHSKGLTLTAAGAAVLEIVQPLLRLREATFVRLRQAVPRTGHTVRLGLTTAFEQGIFNAATAAVRAHYGSGAHLVRAASPHLVRDVRKGRLDAALVALPLDTPGLAVSALGYREPLVAALPTQWGVPPETPLPLRRCNGRPLFWFRREANPAFFDAMKAGFAVYGFSPHFLEEPAEHDVLLARIAAGEGMGLFAASFAAIRREGVHFAHLAEKDLGLALGLAQVRHDAGLLRVLQGCFAVGHSHVS